MSNKKITPVLESIPQQPSEAPNMEVLVGNGGIEAPPPAPPSEPPPPAPPAERRPAESERDILKEKRGKIANAKLAERKAAEEKKKLKVKSEAGLIELYDHAGALLLDNAHLGRSPDIKKQLKRARRIADAAATDAQEVDAIARLRFAVQDALDFINNHKLHYEKPPKRFRA